MTHPLSSSDISIFSPVISNLSYIKKYRNRLHFDTYLLANSANTKCRPFQVKINCSKFIINRLQQRCHVTLLISLFATSRNLLFGVFLPRKNTRKFQASVTERCTSLSKCSGMFRQNLLKIPVKKFNL